MECCSTDSLYSIANVNPAVGRGRFIGFTLYGPQWSYDWWLLNVIKMIWCGKAISAQTTYTNNLYHRHYHLHHHPLLPPPPPPATPAVAISAVTYSTYMHHFHHYQQLQHINNIVIIIMIIIIIIIIIIITASTIIIILIIIVIVIIFIRSIHHIIIIIIIIAAVVTITTEALHNDVLWTPFCKMVMIKEHPFLSWYCQYTLTIDKSFMLTVITVTGMSFYSTGDYLVFSSFMHSCVPIRNDDFQKIHRVIYQKTTY